MRIPISALLVVLIAAWPVSAAACRCAQQTLKEYYQDADIVFLAEIVSVATVEPDDGGPTFRNAQPRIIDAFKGAEGIQHVRTPASSAACGIALAAGERYWVFAERRIGAPVAWIDSCNGSRRADADFENAAAADVASRLRNLAAAGTETGPAPFTDPACWSAPRVYHTGDPPAETAQKITLTRTDEKHGDFAGVKSPNGAYAFDVQNPTGIQRPPRVATVTVDTEREYRLALRLHGVAKPIEPQWINEKLVFVRVGWSATAFTDLILDVEAEELIYSEVAWDGTWLFEEKESACVRE